MGDKLENSRQTKLQEVGNMFLDEYTFALIVPVPHRFYKSNSVEIFNAIEANGWHILNKSTTRLYEAYNVKDYIYDSMLPLFTKNNRVSFKAEHKSLLLKKDLQIKASLLSYEFEIKEVSLWIFQDHIAFFTIFIDIDFKKYKVNELLSFQNYLRNFKFIKIEQKEDSLNLIPTKVFDGARSDVLNYLLNLTKLKDGRNFLRVKEEHCVKTYIDGKVNYLCNIHNSTISAKTISAMQLSSDKLEDGTPIEELQTESLNFLNTKEMSLLNEFNYYLGANLPLDCSKQFIPNDEYIYTVVSNYGYNVWKYSSGLILHDSCSFVGIKNYGGEVVDDCRNSTYFLYMLNLYVSFQLKYIEQRIIDKDFKSLNISVLYEKLQVLKNQYISEEAGVKFREKELNKAMQKGLHIKENVTEITDNLITTKEIIENHMAIYTVTFAYLLTLLTQNIPDLYKVGILIFAILLLFAILNIFKEQGGKFISILSNFFKG